MYLSLHLERKIFLRYPNIIRAIWLHHFMWISPSLWFYGRSKIESKSSRFRCLFPYRLVASNLGRYKAIYPLFAAKLSFFLNLLSRRPGQPCANLNWHLSAPLAPLCSGGLPCVPLSFSRVLELLVSWFASACGPFDPCEPEFCILIGRQFFPWITRPSKPAF